MASKTQTKNMLALFCGTKSVGKVAEPRGWTVYSLDSEKKRKLTWCVNFLKWEGYKNLDFVPDFIWASPPCTTFSIATHKHRSKDHMKPKTPEGKIGDKLLRKTVKIIRYFQKLNPNLKWCFENPRGRMRYSKYVKGLDRATCCYCQYSQHPFMKPTDLWSNLGLELEMCKDGKNCHHEKRKQPNGKRGGVMGANHIDKRYAIPAELIESILDQAKI